MATEHFAGPVNYLVFAFDAHADLGGGLAAVLESVQAGTIEILDVELVSRGAAGEAAVVPLSVLDGVTGVDLAVFEGAESGILDDEDLAAIAAELSDGQVALAVVYEDRSLAAAAQAWTAAGGVEVFSGGIDIHDLAQTLDEGDLS